MTPDYVSLLMKGQTLVDVRRSDGNLIKVPRWNVNGAPSLNAWVRQQVSGAAPSAPASDATPRTPQGAGPMNQPPATKCNVLPGAAERQCIDA